MDFTEQLRILQAAQGNPALLALATVDLAHNALAAEERTRIKDALVAAAVPHWCDRDFLAALLDTTPEEGERLLGQLRALTVVEPFPARGEHAVNVHEAARLALREHLRATDVARWKALSTRARAHVCQGTEPHTRIEALYHLFAINQPAAAACEALDREFTDGGRPEVRHALALALRELTDGGWLTESAQVEALLAPLMVRHWRGEAAQLEAEARYIADLARTASDPSGIGRTQLLLGDVLQTKGRLDEALAAFREALAIFQRLASTDPSNAGWQRDLAVAHAKVGDILQTQGRLDEALAAFREAFAIFQRLASLDPSNADWQRELGVTHDRVGDIVQAQGRLDEALATFREAFAISQRLASTEPSNANWQRDLAIAHSSLGQAYQSMGNEKNAQSCYRSAVDAMEQAVAMSPGNVGWKQDLDNLKSWLSSGGGSLHE
jgi:tetratricopeptide (TPR) repeat protein